MKIIAGVEKAFGEPTGRRRNKQKPEQQVKAAFDVNEDTQAVFDTIDSLLKKQGFTVDTNASKRTTSRRQHSVVYVNKAIDKKASISVYAISEASGQSYFGVVGEGIYDIEAIVPLDKAKSAVAKVKSFLKELQAKETSAVATRPVAMAVRIPADILIGTGCERLTKVAGVNCHVHPSGMFNTAVLIGDNHEAILEGMRNIIKADVKATPAEGGVVVGLCNAEGVEGSISEVCLALTQKVAHLGCSAHLVEGYDHPLGGKLIAVIMDSDLSESNLRAAQVELSQGLDEDDLVNTWVGSHPSTLHYKGA